jgi:spore coat protein U-like protein
MEFTMSKSTSLLATFTAFAIVCLIGTNTTPSSATGTTALNVSATVTPDCIFGASSYSAPLGALDTVGGAKAAAYTIPLVITCNQGTNTAEAIELAFDDGNNSAHATPEHRAMTDGTNYLSYTLSTSSGGSELGTAAFKPTLGDPTTAGNVDSYTYDVYAFVQSTDTQIASTATYKDTVTVTVTP